MPCRCFDSEEAQGILCSKLALAAQMITSMVDVYSQTSVPMYLLCIYRTSSVEK